MKNYLLFASLLFSTIGFSQSTDLMSIKGSKYSPSIIHQNKTYTSCSYLQEGNALENGRVSDTSFPLMCADDFIVPNADCWTITNVKVPFFTNAPTDASNMIIRIFADAGGTPGAVIQTVTALPAEWSTTLLGNMFSLDVHLFDINLNTPINICGGGAGTTYWFSCQATSPSTFYWEFTTLPTYGSNGVNGPATAGPWSAAGDNFVFELVHNAGSAGVDVQVACDSLTWIDGNTYTSNNNTATYNIVGGGAGGCDSLVTLDLTVNNSASGTDTQVVCDSLTWLDGNTYTANNTTATFTISGGASSGCDSLVTLNLTVNNSSSGTDTQVSCNSFLWIDGNTYTSSNNTATFNIAGGSMSGCDSLVTLDLTINSVDVTTTNASPTLTANNTNSGVTYQWIDCDNSNMPISGETGVSFTATSNGSYAVIVTENGCSDTSACSAVTGIGINGHHAIDLIEVYPNPSSDVINITVSSKGNLTLFASDGKLVWSELTNQGTIRKDMNQFAKGVYTLTFESSEGRSSKQIVLK